MRLERGPIAWAFPTSRRFHPFSTLFMNRSLACGRSGPATLRQTGCACSHSRKLSRVNPTRPGNVAPPRTSRQSRSWCTERASRRDLREEKGSSRRARGGRGLHLFHVPSSFYVPSIHPSEQTSEQRDLTWANGRKTGGRVLRKRETTHTRAPTEKARHTHGMTRRRRMEDRWSGRKRDGRTDGRRTAPRRRRRTEKLLRRPSDRDRRPRAHKKMLS